MDPSFLTALPNKFHYSSELLIRQLKFRIFGCTPYREYSKKPPTFYPQTYQEVFQLLQTHITMLIYTSNHIKNKIRNLYHQLDRFNSPFKTLRVAPHPVMIRRKTVKTDRSRMQSGIQQPIQSFTSHI